MVVGKIKSQRDEIRRWHGFPRTEVANILDHLQKALHLHQAVEWRAALGQRKPARREQHLGGCGRVSHTHIHTLYYLSVLCP